MPSTEWWRTAVQLPLSISLKESRKENYCWTLCCELSIVDDWLNWYLLSIYSHQIIKEYHQQGKISQGEDGGEHGGVVEEICNGHKYAINIFDAKLREKNGIKCIKTNKGVSIQRIRCIYSSNWYTFWHFSCVFEHFFVSSQPKWKKCSFLSPYWRHWCAQYWYSRCPNAWSAMWCQIVRAG